MKNDIVEMKRILQRLPRVRATLISQRTLDGTEFVTSEIGTQYWGYPIAQKTMAWARTDSELITNRLCVFVTRIDNPDDIGGWLPMDLFKFDED